MHEHTRYNRILIEKSMTMVHISQYCEWNVAIKKTHYRSKEFAILTKIHHRNIMPLLAFIPAEESPTSKDTTIATK